MSITVIHEVWRAIKGEIDGSNLSYAAESLVDVLIQNDYEASDIRAEFRKDSEVMDALKAFVASQEDEEEDYQEEDEEDEDYDDNW